MVELRKEPLQSALRILLRKQFKAIHVRRDAFAYLILSSRGKWDMDVSLAIPSKGHDYIEPFMLTKEQAAQILKALQQSSYHWVCLESWRTVNHCMLKLVCGNDDPLRFDVESTGVR